MRSFINEQDKKATKNTVKNTQLKALKAAFPYTIPILTGFLFLGISYGIFMSACGFSFVYPMLMSLLIFAGSVEFVTGSLLLGTFNPIGAFLLAFMLNARHIFYGLSLLSKYGNCGKKKWYLIFGMCDESFSINCTTNAPEGVDESWFMTWVTILNQCYWVTGATIGGLVGNYISFNTTGLEFVMTALFIVLFLEKWLSEKNHISSILGLILSAISVLFFGSNFIIPAMVAIFISLTLLRKKLEVL